MEEIQDIYPSLFEEIGSTYDDKIEMIPIKIKEKIDITTEEIEIQGILKCFKLKHSKYVENHYIKTLDMLIKCSKKNINAIKYVTFLRYPILSIFDKIECNQTKYYFLIAGINGHFLFLFDSISERYKWYDCFLNIGVQTKFLKHYQPGQLLGVGNFAKVFVGTRIRDKKEIAFKQINKNNIMNSSRLIKQMKIEINILRKLSHQGIMKIYEVFEGKDNIYLIIEYLKGGDLFDFIRLKKCYNEQIALKIMKPFLEALDYLHSVNIIHRDLKPENLIFEDNSDNANVKIADFGLAMSLEDEKIEFLKCGSPGYIAPEILNGQKYDIKVDIFSAGVILYILLTGVAPFNGKNCNETLKKNKAGKADFNIYEWKDVSEASKDLCMKMMSIDPCTRITALEALDHIWFKETNNNKIIDLDSKKEKIANLGMKENEKETKETMKNEDIFDKTPLMSKRKLNVKEQEMKEKIQFTPLISKNKKVSNLKAMDALSKYGAQNKNAKPEEMDKRIIEDEKITEVSQVFTDKNKEENKIEALILKSDIPIEKYKDNCQINNCINIEKVAAKNNNSTQLKDVITKNEKKDYLAIPSLVTNSQERDSYIENSKVHESKESSFAFPQNCSSNEKTNKHNTPYKTINPDALEIMQTNQRKYNSHDVSQSYKEINFDYDIPEVPKEFEINYILGKVNSKFPLIYNQTYVEGIKNECSPSSHRKLQKNKINKNIDSFQENISDKDHRISFLSNEETKDKEEDHKMINSCSKNINNIPLNLTPKSNYPNKMQNQESNSNSLQKGKLIEQKPSSNSPKDKKFQPPQSTND